MGMSRSRCFNNVYPGRLCIVFLSLHPFFIQYPLAKRQPDFLNEIKYKVYTTRNSHFEVRTFFVFYLFVAHVYKYIFWSQKYMSGESFIKYPKHEIPTLSHTSSVKIWPFCAEPPRIAHYRGNPPGFHYMTDRNGVAQVHEGIGWGGRGHESIPNCQNLCRIIPDFRRYSLEV